MSASIHRGARAGTAEGFLRPVMQRKNLHVITGAHVTRVRLCQD